MLRSLATVIICAAAIVVGDALFRTSLLSQVRPIILTPPDQAVITPPLQVRWEGPQRMRVWLAIVGEAPHDLGEQESPFDIGSDQFPRDGGYQLTIEAPHLGRWIRAQRSFQVHTAQVAAPPPSQP